VLLCFLFISNAWFDLEAWFQIAEIMLSVGLMATGLALASSSLWWQDDRNLSAASRAFLRGCFKESELSAPKALGCSWCKEAKAGTLSGDWRSHNVFDKEGRLACPHLLPEGEPPNNGATGLMRPGIGGAGRS
jgi:hypothetical protein